MKKLFPILLLCGLMCSCVHTEPTAPFIGSENVQFRVNGRSFLNYDPINCQKYFDTQNNEFVVSSDNGDSFYSVGLSQIPDGTGQQVVADLEWTANLGSLRSKNNIVLDVVKIKDDKIWLWNAGQQIEACIQIIR